MLIQATQKYTRQTPRKVRLIANTVKKLSVENALNQLAVIERRSTMVVAQTLRQAIANAIHNHGYKLSDLAIDNILVNEGPRYKRFSAASRGRAHSIVKRTSHVTVVLKTKEEEAKKEKEVQVEAKAEEVIKEPVVAEKAVKKTVKKTAPKKK